MTTRNDAEADEVMRLWREWLAATGAPETLAAMRGDAPEAISGDGIDLAITCDACPVQIAGTVDGMHLYFRARSGEWRCAIAASEGAALEAGRFAPPDVALYYADGDDPSGGWMPHADAWRIVREAVAAFRAQAVTP